MTTVRIRNNSLRLITLPAIGTPDESVKGPGESIRLAPGTVTPVEGERLRMYESPAFLAKFEEGKNGERPALEILPPTAQVKSTADLLKSYDEENKGKTVKAPEVVASGNSGRVNSKGEPVASTPGESGAVPSTPVGSALDAVQ